MTDLELAEEIDNQLNMSNAYTQDIKLELDQWQQIIAALRRGPPSWDKMIADLRSVVASLPERPPSGEMVCPDCGSRHLRIIYECFNERCDWRGSLSAAEASKEAK